MILESGSEDSDDNVSGIDDDDDYIASPNVVLTLYVTLFYDFLKLVVCCVLSTCLLNEYE